MEKQIITKIFKDKNYCLKELNRAIKLISDKSLYEGEIEGLEKALTLMILYCSEEFKLIFKALLNELIDRKNYFIGKKQ